MQELEQEIKQAISKNLPAQVGEVLTQRLAEATRLEEKVKELNDKIQSNLTTISTQNKELNALRELKMSKEMVDKLLKDFQEKDRGLTIAMLEVKLTESEKRADMVMGFTNSLVRNTIVRKSILDSDNKPGFTDNTGMYHPTDTTKNYDETKTEE